VESGGSPDVLRGVEGELVLDGDLVGGVNGPNPVQVNVRGIVELLANLYPGDFFGHIPFLDIGQEPYSASVFGSKDLKISEIDSDIFEKEYNQLMPTFKNFIEHLASCISATSMLACEFRKNTVRKTPGKS